MASPVLTYHGFHLHADELAELEDMDQFFYLTPDLFDIVTAKYAADCKSPETHVLSTQFAERLLSTDGDDHCIIAEWSRTEQLNIFEKRCLLIPWFDQGNPVLFAVYHSSLRHDAPNNTTIYYISSFRSDQNPIDDVAHSICLYLAAEWERLNDGEERCFADVPLKIVKAPYSADGDGGLFALQNIKHVLAHPDSLSCHGQLQHAYDAQELTANGRQQLVQLVNELVQQSRASAPGGVASRSSITSADDSKEADSPARSTVELAGADTPSDESDPALDEDDASMSVNEAEGVEAEESDMDDAEPDEVTIVSSRESADESVLSIDGSEVQRADQPKSTVKKSRKPAKELPEALSADGPRKRIDRYRKNPELKEVLEYFESNKLTDDVSLLAHELEYMLTADAKPGDELWGADNDTPATDFVDYDDDMKLNIDRVATALRNFRRQAIDDFKQSTEFAEAVQRAAKQHESAQLAYMTQTLRTLQHRSDQAQGQQASATTSAHPTPAALPRYKYGQSAQQAYEFIVLHCIDNQQNMDRLDNWTGDKIMRQARALMKLKQPDVHFIKRNKRWFYSTKYTK